jgi:hypothetical protein
MRGMLGQSCLLLAIGSRNLEVSGETWPDQMDAGKDGNDFLKHYTW